MPHQAGLILGQIHHRMKLNMSQMPGDSPGGAWAVLELTGTLETFELDMGASLHIFLYSRSCLFVLIALGGQNFVTSRPRSTIWSEIIRVISKSNECPT